MKNIFKFKKSRKKIYGIFYINDLAKAKRIAFLLIDRNNETIKEENKAIIVTNKSKYYLVPDRINLNQRVNCMYIESGISREKIEKIILPCGLWINEKIEEFSFFD